MRSFKYKAEDIEWVPTVLTSETTKAQFYNEALGTPYPKTFTIESIKYYTDQKEREKIMHEGLPGSGRGKEEILLEYMKDGPDKDKAAVIEAFVYPNGELNVRDPFFVKWFLDKFGSAPELVAAAKDRLAEDEVAET